MVRTALVAWCLCVLGAAACGDAPGRVSVAFSWEGRPTDGAVVWIRVEIRDLGADAAIAATSLQPVTLTPGPVALTVPAVPHGTQRQVALEIFTSDAPDARARWYGLSEPFSLAANDTLTVPVRVQLAAPQTEGGNTVAVSVPGLATPLPGPQDVGAVDVTFTTRFGRRIVLANNLDLSPALTVDVDAPPDGVTCSAPAPDEATTCVVSGWDLRDAAGETPTGLFNVYARFIDAHGYGSELIRATVFVDELPPVIVSATVTPPVAPAGGEVTVSVTTNEPIRAPTLTPIPALQGLDLGEPVAAGNTWTWRGFVQPGAPETSHSFKVSLQDLVSNPDPPSVSDLTDQTGAPLTVTIDATPPVIDNIRASIADANIATRSDGRAVHVGSGDVLTLTFQVDDATPDRTRVTLRSLNIPCVGGSAPGDVSCTTTLTDAHAEGPAQVAVNATDGSGNTTFVSLLDLQIDHTPPRLASPIALVRADGFAPATAAPGLVVMAPGGGEVTLTATLTEPVVTHDLPPHLLVHGQSHPPEGYSPGDTVLRFTIRGPFPEGDHAIGLIAADRAGNAAQLGVDGATLRYDATPPAALNASSQTRVELFRAPWGAPQTDWLARTELRSCPGWDWCPTQATTPWEPFATVELTKTLAAGGCSDELIVAQVLGADGALPAFEVPGAWPRVCLRLRDAGGNVGAAALVAQAEWVGNLGDKVPGSDQANPLQLEAWPAFLGTLQLAGGRQIGAAHGVARPDAAGHTVEGAAFWRRLSSETLVSASELALDEAVIGYDAVRGELVLAMGCARGLIVDGDGAVDVRLDCGTFSTDVFRWNGRRWERTPVSDPEDDGAPLARVGAAMAVDPVRGDLLLFGGATEEAFLRALWRWTGSSWESLVGEFDGAESKPPSRGWASLVWDGAQDAAWMFGGCDDVPCRLATPRGDLWRYERDAGWSSVTVSGGPDPRYAHAAAYDAGRGEVVLFGGHPGGQAWCDDAVLALCDGTWRFDGTRWLHLGPADHPGPYPSGRFGHSMSYDADRQRVVMWGCIDLTCSAVDTWEWDGGRWEHAAAAPDANPPRRRGQAMQYDAAQRRTILVGGQLFDAGACRGTTGDSGRCADTWAWDGSTWQVVSTVPTTERTGAPGDPPPVALDAAVSRAGTGTTMITGGEDVATGALVGSWLWDGAGWGRAPAGPPPRRRAALAGDDAGGFTLFGGLGDDGTALGDLWRFEGGAWRQVTGLTDPPDAREGARMVWEATRGTVLMMGGQAVKDGATCPFWALAAGAVDICTFQDTWRWDVAAQAWEVVAHPTYPDPRALHALAHDVDRGVTVLYGGARPRNAQGTCPQGVSSVGFEDCFFLYPWELADTSSPSSWARSVPLGEAMPDPEGDGEPDPRIGAAMVYDTQRQQVLLYGGLADSDVGCDTDGAMDCRVLWGWDGASFARVPIADALGESGPRPVTGQVHMVWDDARGEVTAFAAGPKADPDQGTGIFALATGHDTRPAHVLRVVRGALGDGQVPPEVLAAEITWSAGADAAPTAGVMLWSWELGTWSAVPGAVTTSTAGAPTTLTVNLDAARRARLFRAPGAAIHLALTPRADRGAGHAPHPALTTDYVAVRLRYRLPTTEERARR